MKPVHSLTPTERDAELKSCVTTLRNSPTNPTLTRYLEILREESIKLQGEDHGSCLDHSAKTVLLTNILKAINPG